MDTQFLEIQNLDSDDLVRAKTWYESEVLPDPDNRTDVWKVWNTFFSGVDTRMDWQYRESYYRWYTDLTWRRLGQLGVDDVVKMGFARQVPMALQLDFDVWEELMLYLNGLIDPQLIESVYTRVQQAFLSSIAIVGEVKKQPVTVAQLVDYLQVVNQSGTDSLHSAELLAKVQLVFSDPTVTINSISSPDKLSDRFVGLVNFFLGVNGEQIWYVVDSFINPERYKGQSLASMQSGSLTSVDSKNSVTSGVVSVDGAQTFQSGYNNIRIMIEARFTRDASGEFTNLDGVLALLDSLATEQGDDAIRELYYFDEGAGKFQWNEALLT